MIEKGSDRQPPQPVENLEQARLRRELKRLVDFFRTHSPYGRPLSESERYDKALSAQEEEKKKREEEKKNP